MLDWRLEPATETLQGSLRRADPVQRAIERDAHLSSELAIVHDVHLTRTVPSSSALSK